MKIVLATSNPVKVADFRRCGGLFKDALTIDQAVETGLMNPMEKDIEETAETYLGNAVIKAKSVWNHLKDPEADDVYVLADDSGFSVNALNGAPGVYTHRWMGYDTPPLEKAAKIVELMKSYTCRLAHFESQLLLLFPNGIHFADTVGILNGYIPDEVPLDTPVRRSAVAKVFFIPELNIFFDDISDVDFEKYTHRGKSIRKMLDHINETMYYYADGRSTIKHTGYIGSEDEM